MWIQHWDRHSISIYSIWKEREDEYWFFSRPLYLQKSSDDNRIYWWKVTKLGQARWGTKEYYTMPDFSYKYTRGSGMVRGYPEDIEKTWDQITSNPVLFMIRQVLS